MSDIAAVDAAVEKNDVNKLVSMYIQALDAQDIFVVGFVRGLSYKNAMLAFRILPYEERFTHIMRHKEEQA